MKKTKAIRFYETGEVDVLKLEEIELPALFEGEILVRHKAIGVNFIDTYYRTGLYPIPLPSGLGTEGAGVVEEIGKGVTEFKVGDRVAYPHGRMGSYSEYLSVPAANAVKIPEGISFEEAASMMVKGLTVWYLFREIAQLKEGDIVLFHAAAGGVGSIACQWAKALNVKLIGTVSTDEKAKEALENGAWKVINYSNEDVVSKVIEYTEGKKVPVVFDGVGKATFEASLDCLSRRGLLVSFGNASGAVTGVNLGLLAQKGSLFVTRPILAHYIDTRERLERAAAELFDLVLRKKITIHVARRYALSEAAQAHKDLQARKTTGSSVLIP